MQQINQIVNLIREKGLYPEVKVVCNSPKPKVVIDNKEYLLFCSSNFLGLSENKNVINSAIKAVKKYGLSSCNSRLGAGTNDIHERLERKIAEFKKEEAAIVFSTGFATNIGTISAIFKDVLTWSKVLNLNIKQERGLIISDELNHASIVDACHLSNTDIVIYKHKDLNDLAEILKKYKNKRKLIVTDTVFSLDGDLAPLPGIVDIAKEYNSLIMIDEAHATGVFGENGRGVAEHLGVEEKIDIKMGTLSKALGGAGGFIAGPKNLIDFLRISSRSYIFSTSPTPATMAGVYVAILEVEKHPEVRKKLWENVDYMRNGFRSLGFDTMKSESQIIPLFVGDEIKAMEMAKLLFRNHIFVVPARYPAVSMGTARIRFTVMATHTKKQIDYLLDKLEKVGKKIGII